MPGAIEKASATPAPAAAAATAAPEEMSNGELLTKLFSQIDLDASGTLSKDEIKAALADLGLDQYGVTAEAALATLDTDDDGAVSLEEWVKNLPAEVLAAIKATLGSWSKPSRLIKPQHATTCCIVATIVFGKIKTIHKNPIIGRPVSE